PPYSVGETGRMGGTKRREIGHGKLAWRAIHPVLPPHHEFPYTVRVVSDITEEIMKVALGQAKDGRIHILGEMSKALTAARAELGEYAPRIETFKIPTDKIREVIGTGGKVIREIVEKTGAKINIEDDGTVKVASADGESIKAAIKWIKSIASD